MKTKGLRLAIICCLFALVVGNGTSVYAQNNKRRYKQPKECRTSKYTCVLKKNDGVPFFCVRTAKQRHQNARKKIRVVSRRNCIRRYPVEYVDEEE